jgi:uncharacterized membrane protein YuzA (DUF378 family)
MRIGMGRCYIICRGPIRRTGAAEQEAVMDLQTLQQFFMWGTIINLVVLMLWGPFLFFGMDFVYRIHGRWFSFSRETFDALIYALVGIAKILWIMFFLVPWLVLMIIA